ncbi:MAG: glucuronate isomerase [Clostridia bacterium]|nr:glucuronate isomerase [Clostridia bacterium]
MFLDENFLLSTQTAQKLYHNCAAKQPIIDYHCHLEAREIYEDKRFANITDLWLGGDHYKWRLMRSFGIDEAFITGDAPAKEKFYKWIEALSTAIGNPLYEWSMLELKNYFGFEGTLSPEKAEEIWELCNRKLAQPDFSARALIVRSGVEVICTTDDPADDLRWHQKLKESDFPVKVLPSFRPDKALGIEKADYLDYLARLGDIHSFKKLKEVLENRLDFFVRCGCKLSDHGMAAIPFAPASQEEIERIFAARLQGQLPDELEKKQFQTALLLFLAEAYHRRGMVMQLHFGVVRDLCARVYAALGPDAGIDAIGNQISITDLAAFFDALDKQNALPKTIVYSLNPNDRQALMSVLGAFQTGEAKGKMQLGSAWWFNDHYEGMREQLSTFASLSHLACFVGMLTDSRSFLSYARHECFRRILCELIGAWVESGRYPDDDALLERIIGDICYRNAKKYFDFKS